jgi:hypothetical protein
MAFRITKRFFLNHIAVLYILLGILWGGGPASDAAADPVDVWEIRFLWNKAVIEVESYEPNLQGVLFLKEPFCSIATYHFKGTVSGAAIEGRHYSGHSFQGKRISDEKISGILTTRTGIRLHVTAKRRSPRGRSPEN